MNIDLENMQGAQKGTVTFREKEAKEVDEEGEEGEEEGAKWVWKRETEKSPPHYGRK